MTDFTLNALVSTRKEILVKVNQKKLAVSTAASLLHLTRQGLWKLRKSFARHGDAALLGLKKGPRRSVRVHNRKPEWLEEKVEGYFNDYGVGPDRLLWIMEDFCPGVAVLLSRSTIYRILVRRKLHQVKQKGSGINPHPGKYTKGYPGEEIQMDTTEPFGKSSWTQISAIDDFSRHGFADFYKGNKSIQAAEFLKRCIYSAPFPIRAVRVDHGSEFKGAFEKACRDLGITLVRNRVRTPEHNGKVERFHRIIEEECLWRTKGTDELLDDIRYQLHRYLAWYNTKRRHGGYLMNKLTPQQKIEEYIITNYNPHPFTLDVNETLILYTR